MRNILSQIQDARQTLFEKVVSYRIACSLLFYSTIYFDRRPFIGLWKPWDVRRSFMSSNYHRHYELLKSNQDYRERPWQTAINTTETSITWDTSWVIYKAPNKCYLKNSGPLLPHSLQLVLSLYNLLRLVQNALTGIHYILEQKT